MKNFIFLITYSFFCFSFSQIVGDFHEGGLPGLSSPAEDLNGDGILDGGLVCYLEDLGPTMV